MEAAYQNTLSEWATLWKILKAENILAQKGAYCCLLKIFVFLQIFLWFFLKGDSFKMTMCDSIANKSFLLASLVFLAFFLQLLHQIWSPKTVIYHPLKFGL
jgi:isoprenylcysteine carboxyl methyltransferase (ICMT) family protein YpbQ